MRCVEEDEERSVYANAIVEKLSSCDASWDVRGQQLYWAALFRGSEQAMWDEDGECSVEQNSVRTWTCYGACGSNPKLGMQLSSARRGRGKQQTSQHDVAYQSKAR